MGLMKLNTEMSSALHADMPRVDMPDDASATFSSHTV